MLDVLVGEAFAARTLCEADALSERSVIGFAVGCVEVGDCRRAGDAYWHSCAFLE